MSTPKTIFPPKLIEILWQNRLFDASQLVLTDGRAIEIQDVGLPLERSDSSVSPEFLNATIYYPDQGVSYHGNIKIDSLSSDFRTSGHFTDPNMSAVVLHVVSRCDVTLMRKDNPVPTLEIQAPDRLVELFERLATVGLSRKLCATYLANQDSLNRQIILSRLICDRLDRKSDEVVNILDSVGGNWSECCYIQLVRSFGFRGQKEALEKLARSLPYQYICQMEHDVKQIEAYLLGMAGYLNVADPDPYTRELQHYFREFRQRYNLTPMPIDWRAGASVRPVSMPFNQLVRIAALLSRADSLLDELLSAKDIYQVVALLDVRVSEYWYSHHYPSRKSSSTNSYGITIDKINLVIINGVIPFLTAYGAAQNRADLRVRALDLYESIPPEVNSYTRHWSLSGVEISNAFDSQAVIQLHSLYCLERQCHSCPVCARQLYEEFHQPSLSR